MLVEGKYRSSVESASRVAAHDQVLKPVPGLQLRSGGRGVETDHAIIERRFEASILYSTTRLLGRHLRVERLHGSQSRTD